MLAAKQMSLAILSASLVLLVAADDGIQSFEDPKIEARPQAPLKVVEFDLNEKHVVAPYYDQELDTVPEERMKFDKEVLKNFTSVVMEITESTLLQKRVVLGLARKPLSMAWHATRNFRALAAKKVGPKVDDDFARGIARMLRTALRKASEEYRREPKWRSKDFRSIEQKERGAREVVGQVQGLMDTIEATLERSPVGLYLNWTAMTINGQGFVELVPYYFNVFKREGYWSTIAIFERFVGIMERFVV